jgi:hypothetical protein
MNKRRMTMIFAAAIFAYALSIDIAVAVDESNTNTQQLSSYTEYPGEVGDMARRAEKQVKEVDESIDVEKNKLEAVKREQYFEDYKEERAGSLLSKDDIAELEAKRAQKEESIRTRVVSEIQYLEAAKANRQKASQIVPISRPALQTSIPGMVKGIVFYDNKGAVLIAGEVVRENDVVMGVKIVRILPDCVEFEKQGNQWKQQVGQSPPPAVWKQPHQISPAQQPVYTNTVKTGK